MKETIIDNVRIIEDDNGNVRYESIIQNLEPQTENNGFLNKIKTWYNNLLIKPYVKIRDYANPFGDRDDFDVGSDGKNGIEAGIKIEF